MKLLFCFLYLYTEVNEIGLQPSYRNNKLCGRPPQYAPAPCDLLTLTVVSKSRVMWPTSVPILVFLGLSVLDLSLMYATDRQTSDRIIA